MQAKKSSNKYSNQKVDCLLDKSNWYANTKKVIWKCLPKWQENISVTSDILTLRYLFENLHFKAFGRFWINNLSLLNY